MKRKWNLLLLYLCASSCWGQPYFEVGAFYLENQFYKYQSGVHDGEKFSDTQYSGNTAAHMAIGYEINLESTSIDVQLKHQSDPSESGKNDLINNNAFGVVVRKYFR